MQSLNQKILKKLHFDIDEATSAKNLYDICENAMQILMTYANSLNGKTSTKELKNIGSSICLKISEFTQDALIEGEAQSNEIYDKVCHIIETYISERS